MTTQFLLPTALAALALVARPRTSQEQGELEPPHIQLPGQGDPQEEMRELFAKVERDLLRMDRYLVEASAGDVAKLDAVDEGGIEDLLRRLSSPPSTGSASGAVRSLGATHARGKRVIDDIDRILELAQSMGGSCNSSGSQQSEKPGSGASGNPQQNGETSRMGGNQPPGQQPGQQPGEQPGQDGQQPTGEDGSPRGNQASPNQPNSGSAKQMPSQPTETPPAPGQEGERWGELPIYTRDLFRAEGGRDLPPQYRDWIDAYYRRLNERSGGR